MDPIKETLIKERYNFTTHKLKNTLRESLPFADGKKLNEMFNKYVVGLIGEETEEDKKARAKNKKKKKKKNKKAKKV